MYVTQAHEQWTFIASMIWGATIGVVGSFIGALVTAKYIIYREDRKGHFEDLYLNIIFPLKEGVGRIRNFSGMIALDIISGHPQQIGKNFSFKIEKEVLFSEAFVPHFPQIKENYDMVKETISKHNERYAEFEKRLFEQVTQTTSLPLSKERKLNYKYIDESVVKDLKNNLFYSAEGLRKGHDIENDEIIEKNDEKRKKYYVLCTPSEQRTYASSDIHDDLIQLKNQLLSIQNSEENVKEAKDILESAKKIESDIINIKKMLDSIRYPYQLSKHRCRFCPSFF